MSGEKKYSAKECPFVKKLMELVDDDYEPSDASQVEEGSQEMSDVECVNCSEKLESEEERYYCAECDIPFCEDCFAHLCKPMPSEEGPEYEIDSEGEQHEVMLEENDHYCPMCYPKLIEAL